eukprot:TRINITY_DN51740_c0_g1_i1.p1 TRINITY_DN51740_c0_g1~~TRINITY_DN51740_c0_g1_i1.p1  ORF type:complete len:125 (+),score=9.10 TRINITY_DN51740_c0_g1_i1:3-377(+)
MCLFGFEAFMAKFCMVAKAVFRESTGFTLWGEVQIPSIVLMFVFMHEMFSVTPVHLHQRQMLDRTLSNDLGKQFQTVWPVACYRTLWQVSPSLPRFIVSAIAFSQSDLQTVAMQFKYCQKDELN